MVGIGDVVHVQLSATSPDGLPESPALASTPGFSLRGQSQPQSSQTHISINGARTDRYTLQVDWSLQAQRVGTFNVGPATVVAGGARYSSAVVTVKVVPAGQAPPRHDRLNAPQPFPGSPFDPWRGLFPDVRVEPEPAPPAPTLDPSLALDAARGQYVFFHATVDASNVVVGQQVTYSVYVYVDSNAPGLEQDDVHEAVAADFVKRSLIPDDQNPPVVGMATAGGRVWVVHLLRRWALFPLHSGDSAIGPMTMVVSQRGAARSSRESETVHVHVTEPPVVGRPPGYALGDVGHFALTAQVDPRDVEQGAAVGVHVELSGTGNLPSTLTTPARADVEWLAPELHDKLGPVGAGGYGGTRLFDFVVRVKRAGQVDLGELALPFWDPGRRRYDVARAALGALRVKPSSAAAAQAAAEAQPEPLDGLPPARTTLERPPATRGHADDSPFFWLAFVGGGPLLFGASVAARAATRRLSRAWRARQTSPEAELRERMAAARSACGGGDPRIADAAVARALETALVVHTGVSVRGAVGDEVAQRLERAGLAHEAASGVAQLLRDCETARFSPETGDLAAARERWTRAQGAIRHLEKRV